jgi:demethylmenaquinone methyltransferase/2-methoxy-6-polyprenyl-1,4-benzoquinol methylase
MISKNKNVDIDFTAVKPYNQDEAKTAQLSRMFNAISEQYDKFNDIMTWGLARNWRKIALKSLKQYDPKSILDIAAGTADMCIKAFQYLQPNQVIGIDISAQMIEVGKLKVAKAGLSDKILLQVEDCSSLSFEEKSFDAATIAFGIRNFEKLNESIQQIHRVLKPNGHLLILEMNEPKKAYMIKAYQLYTQIFVKLTAKYLSTDKKAYDYLTASMHAFPSGNELISILNQNKFKLCRYRRFVFGVCSMYLVERIE